MKALRIRAPGQVEVTAVPDPVPGPDEVIVRVDRVGICATDRKLVGRPRRPGLIPGHEIGGTLPDGTRVGVHPDVGCGRCQHCRAGFDNRCPARCSIGVDRDGGLAELVAVPAAHVVALEGVDASVAPLLEPLACCLHAIDLLGVSPSEAVLVVGAGPLGLLTTLALKAIGATVVVSQRSPDRRRAALAAGADAAMGPEDDPSTVLGRTPTAAIVTAPTTEALAWALARVEIGGRVHAFAGLPGDGAIDANTVHYRHLSLIGSTGSRLRDYRRARELVAGGQIDPGRLPLRPASLDDVPGLLEADTPEAVRVIVTMERSSD
ncbi:MAG TPA: alcohol dehydrogenase catalytic domain-containing protein [Candidatus Limnocylindrales bacterium]|nr:alcohol dehydrogenase catalytic domain-containing protein [Candidatus Limnocylindrales bacterium]